MSSIALLKNGFFNVSYLAIGNITSQLIGIVSFVYIAKMLGPSNYGIYSTVIAYVSIFNIFTLSGLSKTLIREGSKDLNGFNKILEDSLGLKIFFIIIAVSICNFSCFFTNYNYQTKLLIWLFSIQLIEIGLSTFFGTIFQVIEKMKYLAYFSILTRIIFSFLSISFLLFGFGITSVVLSNIVARFSVLIINIIYSQRYIIFNFKNYSNLNFNKSIFSSSILFSLITFVNTFAIKIDVLMISFLSTPNDVGLYSVAYKITSEGEILRNIIATAFFPIIVKFHHQSNNKSFTFLFKTSICLFASIFFVCIILSFFSKNILIFVFGKNFSISGYILKYLIFCLPFSYYTIPLTLALQTTNNEKLLLISSFIIAALNIPLNIILFQKFGLVGIAYSTLIVYFVHASVLTILTFNFLWIINK